MPLRDQLTEDIKTAMKARETERHSQKAPPKAVTKSPAPAQLCPVAHLGQLEPQSLSVSVPFLTESVQVGA